VTARGLLLLAVGLPACMAEDSMQVKAGGDLNEKESSDSGDSAGEAQRLRLDVYPSTEDLVPQSKETSPERATGLEIELEHSILVSGRVSAWQTTPPPDIEVPGEAVPVVATVRLEQAGTVSRDATMSDANGSFHLEIPPGDDWVLSVVPSDPPGVPFLVESGLALEEQQSLTALTTLGAGEPVYGVVREAGEGVDGATVHLVDPETGIAGGGVETDSNGYYLLRALPGTYSLVVTGEAGLYYPTVSVEIDVVEDEGATFDLDYGVLSPVAVRGRVVEEQGQDLGEVVVRFTALDLDDPAWSLVVETEADGNGLFRTELLPGRWTVEFLPAYELHLTPLTLEIEVGTSAYAFDEDVVLAGLTSLRGRVLGPDGSRQAGVAVQAQELCCAGNVYASSTNADGIVEMEVPAVPLQFTFTPSDAGLAIQHRTVDAATEQLGSVTLPEGEPVRGTVTADGEPVPYAVVEIRGAEDDRLYGTTLTGEDGSFSARIDW
jgi:hypothetical protein